MKSQTQQSILKGWTSNVGGIFINILKALFSCDFLCICIYGMDVLDGEGFGGRFTPSTNNTTYLKLLYKCNAFYLV